MQELLPLERLDKRYARADAVFTVTTRRRTSRHDIIFLPYAPLEICVHIAGQMMLALATASTTRVLRRAKLHERLLVALEFHWLNLRPSVSDNHDRR